MECMEEKEGKRRRKNKESNSGQPISYFSLSTIVKTYFFSLINEIQSFMLRENVFLLAKELKQ